MAGLKSRRRTFFIWAILAISMGTAWVFTSKFHHVSNFYSFLFDGGPYINRTFITKHHVINPGSRVFDTLVHDAALEDRRGNFPAFDQPLSRQLVLPSTPAEQARYKDILRSLKSLTLQSTSRDSLAISINQMMYANNEKNKRGKHFDPAPTDAMAEKDRHIEDVVLGFANYYSACGTISESTIALLRSVGFKTRILRISESPSNITANHVFLEYYSYPSEKWVMLDPLVGFTPRLAGKPLSAFEFFASDDKAAIYRESGSYPYDKATNTIWFNRNGPVKDIFYFSRDGKIRKLLRQNL